LAKERKVREAGEGYQLREFSVPNGVDFGAENGDIDLESTCFWKVIHD
jgi:hypothetical protein